MFKNFNQIKAVALAMLALVMATTFALGQGRTADPYAALKRALTQAAAPALSTAQETALTALVNEFKAALPDEDDEVLDNAREAYDAAIIAGDLAAAQAQISIITNRTAQLQDARMQAQAKFSIGALSVLKTGGQYDLLVAKYGSDRVLGMITMLTGRGGKGPDGPGEGRR